MKKLVTFLGLLTAVPAFSKECQKEQQKARYHIYNTSVEIKTIYCFDEVGDEFLCEKFKATDAIVAADDASRYCPLTGSYKRVFCKLPSYANLVDNKVVLAGNTICQYDRYYCNITGISKVAFWTNRSACRFSLQAYQGEFDVWAIEEGRRNLIRNGRIGVVLTEKDKFCGVEVWRTNYEGIIASTADINSSEYKNYSDFKQNFKPFSKRLCESRSLKPVLRTWYIYKYPIEVTVYACPGNSSSPCELPPEKLPTNNSRLLELHSKVCEPNATLCRKTHEVDLEHDAVMGLPGCKYSEGLCRPFKAFWHYTNRCKEVQEVYESYETRCGKKKCVDQRGNSTKLILEREGKLCEESVWYTDQLGLVASEKVLGFYQSTNIVIEPQKHEDSSWFHPEPDLSSTQGSGSVEYYIVVALAICVFGIALKIAACLAYLCARCKKRNSGVCKEVERGRMGLADDFNRSLTRFEQFRTNNRII
ncbi:uncharacterized protein LOC108916324 [Anoplophora glabripennis]|uniref:uncharacterized protein LOC108916324 n=1 Tax=Anoplophora glabripennis TaxID=217634 RepID=UPI000874E58C|nr:uncharacterized protein LOC108916324 [Anoplophora glabripennis]